MMIRAVKVEGNKIHFFFFFDVAEYDGAQKKCRKKTHREELQTEINDKGGCGRTARSSNR